MKGGGQLMGAQNPNKESPGEVDPKIKIKELNLEKKVRCSSIGVAPGQYESWSSSVTR